MDYTTRLDDDPAQAHINYACPCGCTAGVMFARETGTVDLGGCCCGRLLWVGDDAEGHVRQAFEADAIYDLEVNEVSLPWGQTVQAVLAVPHEAEHGSRPVAVAAGTVHDPVCHMDISPESAYGTSEYKGTTYYFCAKGCKLDFDEDPEAVLKAEAEHDHSKPFAHNLMTSETSGSRRSWWQFWKN